MLGIDPTGAYTGTSELQMERIDVRYFSIYHISWFLHFTLSFSKLNRQMSKI